MEYNPNPQSHHRNINIVSLREGAWISNPGNFLYGMYLLTNALTSTAV